MTKGNSRSHTEKNAIIHLPGTQRLYRLVNLKRMCRMNGEETAHANTGVTLGATHTIVAIDRTGFAPTDLTSDCLDSSVSQ